MKLPACSRPLPLYLAWLCCCALGVPASAQQADKKQMAATRMNEEIQLDGRLDDPAWLLAEQVTNFVDREPQPGIHSADQTRVRVLYDDRGVYIGAEMDEREMSGLGTELFERDNLDDRKKIDWFGVVIDCYKNGLQGFAFVVAASGVQTDIKFSPGEEDGSWDAVWDCQVAHHADSWTCEILIPYSALRFPEKPVQEWGIQFGRRSYQRQQECFWNPIDPEMDGFVNQCGIITGIENIKPPIRLSLTPFFAVYAENFLDPKRSATQRSSWGSSYNGGMDVKYGISDAYTLDMTLIPDFGQVQSDNQILNLTPFEVQFNENRQFFTEGTELFNKAGLFYSRRVGGTPYYFDHVFDQLGPGETVDDIRGDSRLINATKISGRDKNGLGIGFFNAVSPRDHARIINHEVGTSREVLLQPWTNYNVTVIDQNLKNNSYIAFVNTNVWREGEAHDANVTGIEFDLRTKGNKYGIAGNGAVSQLVNPGETNAGYRYNLEVARQSGNLIWELGYNVESDTYDHNDLGFLYNNNEKRVFGFMEYNQFEPFGPFLSGGGGFYVHRQGLFKFPGVPASQFRDNLFTDAGIEFWFYGRFKNHWRINPWIYIQPFEGYDYFEPREPGRFFAYPAFKNIGLNINSDNRKRLTYGGFIRFNKFHENRKYQLAGSVQGNYRINNHLSLGYEASKAFYTLDRGFVDREGEEIIFGARDYKDLAQVIRVSYNFNPRANFLFRLRHNWTRVEYTHFYTLLENGGIEDRPYSENANLNFNAWTIDTQFRWRFAPGSDIFIVWKQAIYGLDKNISSSFGENLRGLFEHPQSNSFSIKAIYYLDVQNW